MTNFTFFAPTRIHFGKDQLMHLAELKESGSRVLLVYGGGSIKRNGLYDKAIKILKESGLTIYELSGVEPNPRIESVRKGVTLCLENQVDMVVGLALVVMECRHTFHTVPLAKQVC